MNGSVISNVLRCNFSKQVCHDQRVASIIDALYIIWINCEWNHTKSTGTLQSEQSIDL